jgi:diguanylate cyclase (GGDEF)-like protein
MHVSFRSRLIFFFLLLVVLPVLAVAAAGYLVVRDSEQGETDARLSRAEAAAARLYDDAGADARRVVDGLSGDPALAGAIDERDQAAVEEWVQELSRAQGLDRVELRLAGLDPITAGDDGAIAPAARAISTAGGAPAGRLALSVRTADEYARTLQAVTGLDVVVSRGDEVLGGTLEPKSVAGLPRRGTVELMDTEYRTTTLTRLSFGGTPIAVRVLADATQTGDAISEASLILLGVLFAFLLSALLFALTSAHSLQAQTQRLLVAAQQVGRGDFSVEIPTEGNDEFALLGREFNRMAGQLETRMDELQTERTRLQEIVRRVGDSIGKGHDRDALLGIVVQTAVDGARAESGRVIMRDEADGGPTEAARAGDVAAYAQAMATAEAAALDSGEAREVDLPGAIALARPLHSQDGTDGILGVMSIARAEHGFSPHEHELFAYLANQAAISVENVDLHRTVQRQAVTDELTGLFNHRRFQEVMVAEVERTKRFGHDLGLIMLDIDNFKQVNDDHGHLQGDLVLREVARVLRESSREIDEPARYGGEEMAVALPQTGLRGAYEFAERVRKRIEALEIPLLDGSGDLRVTASFGAAALPHSADIDKDALFAAADGALYQAKRTGKNRTVKAE